MQFALVAFQFILPIFEFNPLAIIKSNKPTLFIIQKILDMHV